MTAIAGPFIITLSLLTITVVAGVYYRMFQKVFKQQNSNHMFTHLPAKHITITS